MASFLSLASSKLRLCSDNHRAGYFNNLACDWLSIVWAYSKQQIENGPISATKQRANDLTTTNPCNTIGQNGYHLADIIFKIHFLTISWISLKISLKCVFNCLIESTFVQVMAWCCQASIHYLIQSWARSLMLLQGVNPLRAKVFRGKKNIYKHLMSYLHIDMTQEVEILPQVRQGSYYFI